MTEITGTTDTFAPRFEAYFKKDAALKAAKSLSDGSEIEFRIGMPDLGDQGPEVFTFTREKGTNSLKSGAARSPQVVFTLTPPAAEKILAHPSEDVASIGVHIAQMIVQPKDGAKIDVQLKAGFLSLISNGYLGVVTSGGLDFANFLASKGLSGMGAIKDVIKKLKG
jgi:hypothetical protein